MSSVYFVLGLFIGVVFMILCVVVLYFVGRILDEFDDEIKERERDEITK